MPLIMNASLLLHRVGVSKVPLMLLLQFIKSAVISADFFSIFAVTLVLLLSLCFDESLNLPRKPRCSCQHHLS